jgi:AraC-like DNA-binding protein
MSRYAALADREWLERSYLAEKRSVAEIAASLGCSKRSVLDGLARNEIARRRRGRPRQYAQLGDRIWLQSQVDLRRKPSEIAAEIGCSESGLRTALDRLDVTYERRPYHRRAAS